MSKMAHWTSGRQGFNNAKPQSTSGRKESHEVKPKQEYATRMAHPSSGREGFDEVATFMAHDTSGRVGYQPTFPINVAFAMPHATSGRAGYQPAKAERVHMGVNCDKCRMAPLRGIRYKCSTCPDYDLCEACASQNDATNEHPHIFLRVASTIDSNAMTTPAILRNRSEWVHSTSCSVCQERVVGYRYFCSNCGVDLCERCEQHGKHPISHTLLKMPPPAVATACDQQARNI